MKQLIFKLLCKWLGHSREFEEDLSTATTVRFRLYGRCRRCGNVGEEIVTWQDYIS